MSTGLAREEQRGGIKAAEKNFKRPHKNPTYAMRSPTFGVEVRAAGLELTKSTKT